MGVLTEIGPALYLALMFFVGFYPLITSLAWIALSLVFLHHRETAGESFYQLDSQPFVSIVMAARNEEAVIERTVRALFALDWEHYEIVVVNDGSTDGTRAILDALVDEGPLRPIHKAVNEGKARALNDAIPTLKGEFVLLIDADARPQPDVLRYLVPHLARVPTCAAVTANPRVANTPSLLAKLQVIEFSATVSVLRRAQTTWGHIMTISGVSTLFRRSAVMEVGMFRPEMSTEDIALTWQLQRAGWGVRYEPRAIFAMQVPEDLRTWWRQRTRWARGQGQVLRRNAVVLTHPRRSTLWLIFMEAVFSGLWAHCFVLLCIVWAVLAVTAGITDYGATPIPAAWGMLVASICAVQIAIGLSLDGRYDRPVMRYFPYAAIFPLVYWLLLSLAAVRATLPGAFSRPKGAVTWTQSRYAVPSSPPTRK